jgi:hypothetical protein
MKKTPFKNEILKKMLVVSFFLLFQKATSAENPYEDSPGGLETPPAPIDDYVIHFAIVAIVLAAFYFYKTNLKTVIK